MRYWIAHIDGDDLRALHDAVTAGMDQAVTDMEPVAPRLIDLDTELRDEVRRRELAAAHGGAR